VLRRGDVSSRCPSAGPTSRPAKFVRRFNSSSGFAIGVPIAGAGKLSKRAIGRGIVCRRSAPLVLRIGPAVLRPPIFLLGLHQPRFGLPGQRNFTCSVISLCRWRVPPSSYRPMLPIVAGCGRLFFSWAEYCAPTISPRRHAHSRPQQVPPRSITNPRRLPEPCPRVFHIVSGAATQSNDFRQSGTKAPFPAAKTSISDC